MPVWTYQSPDQNGNKFGPIDQGYFVSPSSIDPNKSLAEQGVLTNEILGDYNVEPSDNSKNNTPITLSLPGDTDYISLYVENIGMDFQLSGSYAQSMLVRQFFTRNFVQPSIIVQGTMSNSFQYQRLAEFVRASHFSCLFPANANLNAADMFVGLSIPHKTYGPITDDKGNKYGLPYRSHLGHHYRGYITNITRGAEKFKNAPEYTFEFVVAYAYGDLYSMNHNTKVSYGSASIVAGFETGTNLAINNSAPVTPSTAAPSTPPPPTVKPIPNPFSFDFSTPFTPPIPGV